MKRKESRWTASSTRLRDRIEQLEQENHELKDEVTLLEKKRLEAWQKRESLPSGGKDHEKSLPPAGKVSNQSVSSADKVSHKNNSRLKQFRIRSIACQRFMTQDNELKFAWRSFKMLFGS